MLVMMMSMCGNSLVLFIVVGVVVVVLLVGVVVVCWIEFGVNVL